MLIAACYAFGFVITFAILALANYLVEPVYRLPIGSVIFASAIWPITVIVYLWARTVMLLFIVTVGFATSGCSAPVDNRTIYTVSAFCGEPCPWSTTGLHTDSAAYGSTDAAIADARVWAVSFGVSQQAVDVMLSYWEPGQDMDVEFPLDSGRQLELLLYTDEVRP